MKFARVEVQAQAVQVLRSGMRLSEDELRALTDADGVTHVVLATDLISARTYAQTCDALAERAFGDHQVELLDLRPVAVHDQQVLVALSARLSLEQQER